MATCSLIISTYNWLPALSLCLKSILTQTVLPDEIIIADDGSEKDTADYIAQFAAQTPVTVKHIWQPDEGFQLAKIRNKAIAAASGDYIIQIDGDLILHKAFVKDHLDFRKQDFFTTGSRMLLSKHHTAQMLASPQLKVKKMLAGNRNFFNSMRIPFLHAFLSQRYKSKGRYRFYVKGCNMAFWKKDLLKVNGYNEDFTGWGKEDSEIAIRLINAGVQKRFLKFGAVNFHLFHNEACRNSQEKNTVMMNETIQKRIFWAKKGIDQYL